MYPKSLENVLVRFFKMCILSLGQVSIFWNFGKKTKVLLCMSVQFNKKNISPIWHILVFAHIKPHFRQTRLKISKNANNLRILLPIKSIMWIFDWVNFCKKALRFCSNIETIPIVKIRWKLYLVTFILLIQYTVFYKSNCGIKKN
jgi:hypothetical protein